MKKTKPLFILLFLVFIVGLVIVGYKQFENKQVDTNTNNDEQVEVEITTIEFGENTNLEEAQGKIYEKYSNNNLRIVGAIIQEVNADYIIVKTYRAGEGTSSIVEEKKINITSNTPVFETVMSMDSLSDPVTTRETAASLKAGDHVVIECADDKSMKDSNEFTALIITKDVLIFDELLEDEIVE